MTDRLTKEREQEIRAKEPNYIDYGGYYCTNDAVELLQEIDALRAEIEEEKLAFSSNLIGQEHRLGSRVERLEKERDALKTENEILQQMAGRSVEIASELRESNEEMKSNLLHCKLTLFGGKSASELMSENRDLRDELDGETNWAIVAGNLEKENQKLRERIGKLREAHKNITTTKCPHFKLMKETCTCVYDEAAIALAQDSEAEGKG